MKAAIFLILSMNVQAYGYCQKNKTDFYFGNGMFNSQAAAREGLDELKDRISKSFSQDTYANYEVAYNTNEFILLQLLQVYRHKKEDAAISFWKWLGDFTNYKNSKVFKDQFEQIFSTQAMKDSDLRKQITRYQKSVDEDHFIITVAHSQGNFYANFAFKKLNSDKTKMISVATPASSVYGNGPYFTFESDGVIAFVPSALPPNLERLPAGLFDHEFIEHYLESSSAANRILNAAHRAYEQFNISYEDDFNSDLDHLTIWFNENFKKKRSEKMSDCLLTYAVFKLIATDISCEEKNYATLLKYLTGCRNGRLDKQKDMFCPFWLGMDFANPLYAHVSGFPLRGDSAFLDQHPHCYMNSYEDYMRKVETSDIDEAISTLEKLKVYKN